MQKPLRLSRDTDGWTDGFSALYNRYTINKTAFLLNKRLIQPYLSLSTRELIRSTAGAVRTYIETGKQYNFFSQLLIVSGAYTHTHKHTNIRTKVISRNQMRGKDGGYQNLFKRLSCMIISRLLKSS